MDILSVFQIIRGLIRPLLDIAILSFLIYQLYKILAQTRAAQLAKGLLLIAVLYAVAFFFRLATLLWLMNGLATVIVIIIAIVFQPELRSIFTKIGRGGWFGFSSQASPGQVDTVVNAVEILAGKSRGALIVFPRKVGIKNIVDTGTRLNAEISSSLILTVFGHDTPLHDGALVIQGGKIVAAGCFLPLSEQVDIRRSFGSRHRAALGLAEESDAIILVVSEETGAFSLAFDANLYYDLSTRELTKYLNSLLNYQDVKEEAEEESLVEE